MEIEAGQGPQVLGLAKMIYPTSQIECHKDLAGLDRLITIAVSGVSDTISTS
jgi:hypothetical protein